MKRLASFLFILIAATIARADFSSRFGAPSLAYYSETYSVGGDGTETDDGYAFVEVSLYKDGYLMAYAATQGDGNAPVHAGAMFSDSGGGNYSGLISSDWYYATTAVEYNPHVIPYSLAASGFALTQFELAWQGIPLSAPYEVSRDGTSLGSALGFSRSITGLQAGQTYAMRVRCYNEGQWSDWSQALSVTVPAPPAPPVAANPSGMHSSGFVANWSTPTGATAYLLDISTDSAFSSFITGYQSRNVGNVASYSVTGLSANVIYYYRVRASSSAGASANSNLMAAGAIDGVLVSAQTFSPVSNTTYTSTATRVRVIVAGGGGLGGHGNDCNDWSANGGAGGYASALYTTSGSQVISITDGVTSSVAVSASISNGFTVSATVGGNADSGANGAPGQGSYDSAYGYVAGSGTAITGGGGAGGIGCANESGQPNSITIRGYVVPTAPVISSQPQSLSAAPGTGVTFVVVATGNPAPAYQWRKNGTNITGATNSVFGVGKVQSSDGANYDVIVYNTGGAVISSPATLTVVDNPPTAPTVLAYVEKTDVTVTLQWRASSDDLGVSYYTVYRGGTAVGTTSNTVFVDSGLSANTTYSYTVKAFDTSDQPSSASSALSVTTTQNLSADSDHDGIPDAVETALGTNGSSAATAATTSQTQQVIHRPIQ